MAQVKNDPADLQSHLLQELNFADLKAIITDMEELPPEINVSVKIFVTYNFNVTARTSHEKY